MSWGILEMLGSAMTLLFATTLALAGAELLVGGNVAVGIGLLGVAIGMILLERYVTTPSDLPVLVASKLVGAVARPPDDE